MLWNIKRNRIENGFCEVKRSKIIFPKNFPLWNEKVILIHISEDRAVIYEESKFNALMEKIANFNDEKSRMFLRGLISKAVLCEIKKGKLKGIPKRYFRAGKRKIVFKDDCFEIFNVNN